MQRLPVEVRPAARRHPNLRIRDLPQEKIAHAHLAGRANEQVGIGHTGRVQGAADGGLVDLVGIERAVAGLPGQGAHGVDQLGAAAVIDGEAKAHAGVVLTEPDGFVDLFQDAIRQVGAPADDAEANVLIEDRDGVLR